jgi:hypothetical protein
MRRFGTLTPLLWLVFALILLGLPGCSGGGSSEPSSEQPVAEPAQHAPRVVGREDQVPEGTREKMRAAALDLMGSLKSRLVQELQAGGPASAVSVCSKVAQEIADKHSGDSMQVRRVSLEVRNPEDTPDDWERQRLEAWHELHQQGELPGEQFYVLERDGGREARYLKPIMIQKPCLSCHGPEDQLSEEVRQRLQELYPNDEATGYELGDLRGAVSVRASLR